MNVGDAYRKVDQQNQRLQNGGVYPQQQQQQRQPQQAPQQAYRGPQYMQPQQFRQPIYTGMALNSWPSFDHSWILTWSS